MNKKVGNNNQSLWQNSMKVAVNMARASAVSIAKKSLGTKPAGDLPPPPPPPPAAIKRSITIMDATSLTVPELSRRSREQKISKYVMELPEEIHVIHEEGSYVDSRATDYIKSFHERMRSDSLAASTLPPILMPPPPIHRVK